MDFKVGDIVRRTKHGINQSCLSEGDEGTIIQINILCGKTAYKVRFHKTNNPRLNGESFNLLANRIELIKNKKKGNIGGF